MHPPRKGKCRAQRKFPREEVGKGGVYASKSMKAETKQRLAKRWGF